MTKPASVPTWDSNGTNITAITGGHSTDGYTLSEIPTSGELNDFMRKTGQWCQYVSDTLNDGTASYSLTADVSNWDPAGTGNTTNLHTIYVTATGSTDGWTIAGLVGGVDGREIDIINVGSDRFYLRDEHTSATAANRLKFPAQYITDNANVAVKGGGTVRVRYIGSASRWRVISTAGCMCRKIYSVSPFNALVASGWAQNDGGWMETTASGIMRLGISGLYTGQRIRKITFERWGDSSADVTVTLSSRDLASSKSDIYSSVVTNPGASWVDEVMDLTSNEIDIVGGRMIWLKFDANAANIRIGEIRVFCDVNV